MVHRVLEEETIARQLPPAVWHGADLAAAGRWKDALRASRQLIQQNPDHLGALEVMCQSLLKLGKFDDALGVIRRLIRLNSAEPGYELLRSQAYQSLGKLPDALAALLRAKAVCTREILHARIEREIQILAGCLNIDPALLSADPTMLSDHRLAGIRSGCLLPTVH